ncbi:MAG: SemiSWEET family sugar transporter [Candidatus Berkiella sp.]
MNNYIFTETVGLIAAFCTTFAFIPQVVQLYRTRVTTGISLGMYCIFTTGVFLWLIYGVILSSPSLIIANALTFIFALCVLVMKWKWK